MTWPVLWAIEPTILTPIMDNLNKFLDKYIATILNKTPLKLKKNVVLNKPVLKIPTKNTLKIPT